MYAQRSQIFHIFILFVYSFSCVLFILATMKWIILVLGERMAHSPEKNVLVQQMELIGSSIRANDGFCKMNCTWMETRSLLLDCGLRLPRAESRAQAVESTKMQSTAASVTPEEQPNTSQPNGSSLTPDTAQPKSDVGLLNSVVNTLSSAGMHILESTENPTTLFSKKMSSSKVLESNYQVNNVSFNSYRFDFRCYQMPGGAAYFMIQARIKRTVVKENVVS